MILRLGLGVLAVAVAAPAFHYERPVQLVSATSPETCVVLPADLPHLTAAEIDGLVRAGRRGGFAIAPDAAAVGTNGLYLSTLRRFRFQFGPDSCRLHLQEAQNVGLKPEVVHLAGLQFDVDCPADLHRLEEQRWRTRLQA